MRFYFRQVRARRVHRRKLNQKHYLEHREKARVFVHNKIKEWNKHYGFKVGRISIRNQRSRWGSCSRKGNLNFNYRIVLLPQHLADYIIVHELCHIGQFNHSQKFWDLVGETLPNYLKLKEELRRKSFTELM